MQLIIFISFFLCLDGIILSFCFSGEEYCKAINFGGCISKFIKPWIKRRIHTYSEIVLLCSWFVQKVHLLNLHCRLHTPIVFLGHCHPMFKDDWILSIILKWSNHTNVHNFKLHRDLSFKAKCMKTLHPFFDPN